MKYRKLHRRTRDERGMTIVLVAVVLVAILGIAALAIDVGMWMTSRSEVQRVADLSALAGAGMLIPRPTDAAAAESAAIVYAAQNDVRQLAAQVLPQDVDVILDSAKVRVRVYRTQARGSALATFFANFLGTSTVDVGAVAAAEAWPASSANCLLPIALPDKWNNLGSLEWDPSEGDTYTPPGYIEPDDIGYQISLKPAQGSMQPGSSRFEPGWWFLWNPTPPGASQVRAYILGCPDVTVTHDIGDWATDKNGNMQAVVSDFQDLIDMDPTAYWQDPPGCNCVISPMGLASPRIRAVPLFDPTTYTLAGSSANFQISNFVGVFIEKITTGPFGQRDVIARFMGSTGVGAGGGSGSGAGPGSMVKVLKLVE
jgi:Flp pilus assembly protein TadG